MSQSTCNLNGHSSTFFWIRANSLTNCGYYIHIQLFFKGVRDERAMRFLKQIRHISASPSNPARRGCTTPGHPTLGTAFVIQNEIAPRGTGPIVLNLQVGQIPVTFDGDVLWMKQNPPTFGKTLTVQQLASVLNLDVQDFDTRCPIQEVSTGLPFLIVPLKNLDAVRRAYVNLPALKKLIASLDAKMIFIFSAETYHAENQINARMFGHEFGVPEDPATGSANGCFAGYLVKHNFFGKSEIEVRVEQGYEIQRPSLLRLRARVVDDAIDVRVGGQVFLVARGELV